MTKVTYLKMDKVYKKLGEERKESMDFLINALQ
jgi:hypothetical protein